MTMMYMALATPACECCDPWVHSVRRTAEAALEDLKTCAVLGRVVEIEGNGVEEPPWSPDDMPIPPPKNFDGVDWEYKILDRPVYPKCSFRGANLMETHWFQGDVRWADFTESDLNWADFTEVKAQNAKFTRANLDCANFTGANLSYADFTGANLSCADFTGANLTETIFTNADLRGAKGV